MDKHRNLKDIKDIVSRFSLPEEVKEDILNIFDLLAKAESEVHGEEIENIHFHEVGSIDAIVDITAFCFFLHKIKPDKIISTPICTGNGYVNCAHGVLPVPTPATAILLEGMPSYAGDIKGELLTPTGAALLKYYVDEFSSQPEMITEKVGYGFGKKDFKKLNAVRAILGAEDSKEEDVIILQCNIDDMTGEEIGDATEKLWKNNIKDLYIENIYMKKNRPAFMLNVIVDTFNKDKVIKEIFKYTSTIGIREIPVKRYTLDREIKTYRTSLGKVRKKISKGYGIQKVKYEYEDLKRISEELNLSISEVKSLLSTFLSD